MYKKKTTFLTLLLSGLALLIASGCTPSQMREATPTDTYAPTQTKALVYVVRPSDFGGAVTSSIWDIMENADKDKFVGLLGGSSQLAYYAEPGEHLFMVIGENADFMRAYLEAGKTYYMLNTVRMGVWKARFSLKPIDQTKIKTAEFEEWIDGSQLLVVTPKATAWADKAYDDIQERKNDYLPKWNEKSPEDKNELTLQKNDGV